MANNILILSDEEVAAIKAVLAWHAGGIRGVGIQHGPTGTIVKSQSGDAQAVMTPDSVVLAQLTAQDGDDDRLYSWQEGQPTETGFQLLDPDGREGTLGDLPDQPAIDIRDDTSRFDLTNAQVVLARGIYTRSEPDGSGNSVIRLAACWLIVSYPMPVGSVAGQVLQMSFAQNRAVWQMIQSNTPLS